MPRLNPQLENIDSRYLVGRKKSNRKLYNPELPVLKESVLVFVTGRDVYSILLFCLIDASNRIP